MDFNNTAIRGEYSGGSGPLFRLVFTTSILTLLTLGLYRFWAKTRIRRYIWSSVSADGDAFEYTGTGLEKFVGFLVAIVVLAVYLGVIQMALFYFGLNMFVAEPETMEQMIAQMAAFYITALAVVPLWWFAKYRARRYKMARTRWRGVRFGVEKGAWGYALRAIGHSILTGLTLGLLLPRQTFGLEKYITDRSWYGNAQFHQGGHWAHLYPAMLHIFIGVGILAIGAAIGVVLDMPFVAVIAGIVGYIWLIVGFVSYRVKSFAYLTRNKTLGERIEFAAMPRTGFVLKTFILGSLAVGIVAALIFGGGAALMAPMMEQMILGAGPQLVALVPIAMYILGLLAVGALSMVWITQPIIAHIVETAGTPDGRALSAIRQRAADDGADAEGFADALDVGGAF